MCPGEWGGGSTYMLEPGRSRYKPSHCGEQRCNYTLKPRIIDHPGRTNSNYGLRACVSSGNRNVPAQSSSFSKGWFQDRTSPHAVTRVEVNWVVKLVKRDVGMPRILPGLGEELP